MKREGMGRDREWELGVWTEWGKSLQRSFVKVQPTALTNASEAQEHDGIYAVIVEEVCTGCLQERQPGLA